LMRCCAVREVKVGPSESPCGGRLQTTACCVWLKTVVVSDAGKAQVMRHVGIRKTVRPLGDEIAVEVSLPKSKGRQNRGLCGLFRDEPGGCPLIGRVAFGR
jgi:hypothetical protein